MSRKPTPFTAHEDESLFTDADIQRTAEYDGQTDEPVAPEVDPSDPHPGANVAEDGAPPEPQGSAPQESDDEAKFLKMSSKKRAAALAMGQGKKES